jgi:hypothetical protein
MINSKFSNAWESIEEIASRIYFSPLKTGIPIEISGLPRVMKSSE